MLHIPCSAPLAPRKIFHTVFFGLMAIGSLKRFPKVINRQFVEFSYRVEI